MKCVSPADSLLPECLTRRSAGSCFRQIGTSVNVLLQWLLARPPGKMPGPKTATAAAMVTITNVAWVRGRQAGRRSQPGTAPAK